MTDCMQECQLGSSLTSWQQLAMLFQDAVSIPTVSALQHYGQGLGDPLSRAPGAEYHVSFSQHRSVGAEAYTSCGLHACTDIKRQLVWGPTAAMILVQVADASELRVLET